MSTEGEAIELETLTWRFLPKRVPLPSHRHATPSGPWPWMDLESPEIDHPLFTKPCGHEDCKICSRWLGYPQSHFPNWTPDQVTRCQIASAIDDRRDDCTVYHIDVEEDRGKFLPANEKGYLVTKENERKFWKWLQRDSRPRDLRIRALVVEELSGPVLQILGASYNVEPFFFSSSLNWIPSRYAEETRSKRGDHITITVTFLRKIPEGISSSNTSTTKSAAIDTRAPLILDSGLKPKILFYDVLNLHLIRDIGGSTLISYHPDRKWCMTTAKDMWSRVKLIGGSVYWQHIFRKTKDPTLLVVAMLWHAIYAWDDALETLYVHISALEANVIYTNDMMIARELHSVGANLLYYGTLLEDFSKSVQFILDTPNPAMDGYSEAQKQKDRRILEKECNNLLLEMRRLDMSRKIQEKRVKNVMNLVFSTTKLQDSSRMKRLMEASVRNSEATRQVAYLLMFFRPADTIGECFRMNVTALVPHAHGSMLLFVIIAIPLTVASMCMVLAFRVRRHIDDLKALFNRKARSKDFIQNQLHA